MFRFADSFDTYTTLTEKWPTYRGGSINSIAGRNGTYGFRITNQQHGVAQIFDDQPTWSVGMAAKITGQGAVQNLIAVHDGATLHISFGIDTDGTIRVYRGVTLIASSAGGYILQGIYYHYQFKTTISDTVGDVTIKVNGISVITLTGIDTRNAGNSTADRVSILGGIIGGNVGTNVDVDDVVIFDGTGTVNNSFTGDVRVQALLPSGAGTTTQWTPLSGANYTNVDEAIANGDTDYNSSATATQKDTYAYGDLTPTAGTVLGVQWQDYSRKDDAGSRSVVPVYRTGGADFDGGVIAIGDTYSVHREIKELNPNTAAAWTIAEINAAEFGVKLNA